MKEIEIVKKIYYPVINSNIEGRITRRKNYLSIGYVYYLEVCNTENNRIKRKRIWSCGDDSSPLIGEIITIDTFRFSNIGLEAKLIKTYTGEIGKGITKSKELIIRRKYFPY